MKKASRRNTVCDLDDWFEEEQIKSVVADGQARLERAEISSAQYLLQTAVAVALERLRQRYEVLNNLDVVQETAAYKALVGLQKETVTSEFVGSAVWNDMLAKISESDTVEVFFGANGIDLPTELQFEEHVIGFGDELEKSLFPQWNDEILKYKVVDPSSAFLSSQVHLGPDYFHLVSLAITTLVGSDLIELKDESCLDDEILLAYNDLTSIPDSWRVEPSIKALAPWSKYVWTEFQRNFAKYYLGEDQPLTSTTQTESQLSTSQIESLRQNRQSCVEILESIPETGLKFWDNGMHPLDDGTQQREHAAFVFTCADTNGFVMKPTTLAVDPAHQNLSLLIVNVSPAFPEVPLDVLFGLHQDNSSVQKNTLAASTKIAFYGSGEPFGVFGFYDEEEEVIAVENVVILEADFRNAIWVNLSQQAWMPLEELVFAAGIDASYVEGDGYTQSYWQEPYKLLRFEPLPSP